MNIHDEIYETLMAARQILIDERNPIIDSVWWWLPWNKRKLARIDALIDKLDMIHYERLKKIK